ncbi:MAG: hypothetical protein Q9219_001042, partial [cf. Caloplaca sp. 3 TL-2023]
MSSAVEAVYIFNQNNDCILEHIYRSRPPAPRTLLPLYQRHPKPRPSVINIPEANPPSILFSLLHSNLLVLSTAAGDVEPLFILEFLHRIIDVFEEFIGAPLLASRIESSYDVVAQLLGEMCDAGSVCNTEPNALRDDVDIPGWMDKFLGGVGLPGFCCSSLFGIQNNPSSTLPTGGLKQQLHLNPSASGPAIPWRRANVRHTSNELYVDILETLHVTLAPSGRPLTAVANGSIAFTSKISGVPDLLLTLSASGGKLGLERAIELPVFHPCVRLARWKERPGELSFVPPDGKFVLAGYEVDLMPSIHDIKSWSNANLQLPVSIEVSKSLGLSGAEFEISLAIYNTFPGVPSTALASRPTLSSRGSGRSTPVFGGSIPTLQDLCVTIPIPAGVRSIVDLRASRGEAYFTASESLVEWRISTKAAASPGTATLRCTVVGPITDSEGDDGINGFLSNSGTGDYDEQHDAYQSASTEPVKLQISNKQQESQDPRKVQQNAPLMPSSASVSFSVKGWLASGIKVDGLVIDTRKSRGLGEGVKPYKGVKYMTVSPPEASIDIDLEKTIEENQGHGSMFYERAAPRFACQGLLETCRQLHGEIVDAIERCNGSSEGMLKYKLDLVIWGQNLKPTWLWLPAPPKYVKHVVVDMRVLDHSYSQSVYVRVRKPPILAQYLLQMLYRFLENGPRILEDITKTQRYRRRKGHFFANEFTINLVSMPCYLDGVHSELRARDPQLELNEEGTGRFLHQYLSKLADQGLLCGK